jgi:hypothetical protein
MYITIIIITIVVTIILYFTTDNSVFYADKQDELKKKLKELGNNDSKGGKLKNDTTPRPKLLPQLQQTPRPRPPQLQQTPRPRPPQLQQTPRPQQPQAPRPQQPAPVIKGQLKQSYQPEVKKMVNSFIENNDKGFKSNLNNFLSKNSTFKATQLTACNTNNPTLDDIICNLKFQYKIQSFI